ncbi:MAG TPA: hypothetical protein VEI94_07100 [Candidatus Bathyarchaeia archaeon]|nr:hypothetical protein [Candidatus Bathyarchaeia archaeon]
MVARPGLLERIAPPIVLLLVVLAAFGDVLFAGRTLSAAAFTHGVLPGGPVAPSDPPATPHLRDVEGAAWVDEPSPYLVHRALAARHLPLWNAAEGLGAPLAANLNAAAFAPLELPVNLWPSPLVQDLAWIFRVWLLGVATALLARRLGSGPFGATAAGVAIMLSGQTLDWIAHHPLHTDVFVVLGLAAGIGVLEHRRRSAAWLAAAVAAGLAGGKPQSALVAAVIGLVWLAAAARDAGMARPAAAAALLRVALAAALGGALAAFVLLPFAETFARASALVRAGRSTQGALRLPLAGLPALAGPVPARLAALLGAPAPPRDLCLPHAGATVLLAAAFGLVRARRRWIAWALAATVALYLTKVYLGSPAWPGRLPLFSAVSYVKYCFPLYLALALLVALSVDGGDATARSSAGRRDGEVRREPSVARSPIWAQGLLVAGIAAELLWLAPHRHPLRVDPYQAAPYLDALRALERQRPGRIAGPVELLPPLVSNAAGFRDLRAIDVLTPDETYDFVTELVAPSEGITWVLADLDPLLVATAPGADLADVRWVLARSELQADALPAAVRTHVSARRLARLWRELDGYSIATGEIGGGIHAFDGERRFHWSCATPCRFRFDLRALPEHFAAGLAAAEQVEVEATLTARAQDGTVTSQARSLALAPDAAHWQDLWLDGPAGRGAPGAIELAITAPSPATVFVGGVGPSPGDAAEQVEVASELAARIRALGGLVRRYADPTALVYENTRALGAAYFADQVVRVRDDAQGYALLRGAPGRAIAAVTEAELGRTKGAALPDVSSGEARMVEDGDGRVVIATQSKSGGLLIVPRLAFPGWQAELDGAAATLLRVDGALVGVVVPAGAHRVLLRDRASSTRRGALISLAALGVWAIVLRRSARAPERGASR